MSTTPPPFFTSVFLITLLLTGVISTLTSISFGDTEAFVDKKESKLNTEEEDKNNYQEKYKQYDFEKYLSNQYEIYKEYAQYYGNLLYIAENPQKNTFFTHGEVKEPDDNRQQKHSDRDDDDDDNDDDNDDNDNHANGKSSFVESNNEKNDIVTKENVIHTLDKSEEEEKEKKTYKNIKIIECSNLNLNNYDVQNYTDVEKILNAKEAKDWSVVQEILNKVTFSENNKHDDADDVDENQVESHIKNSKEPHQYNIGSETKIIFICTNDNLNMEPTNADNNLIRSLPDEGIILPITAPTENNNNNNNNYEQFASKKEGKLAGFLAGKQEGKLEQFASKKEGKLAELANEEEKPQGNLAELASKQQGKLEQFESKQNELANEEDEQEGKLERLASKLKELVQQQQQ